MKETGARQGWPAFALVFVGIAAGLGALLVLALVIIDPYGTGRLTPIRSTAVAPQQPITANAARARDPAFDAAVIGNSKVQMLRPEALNRATGLAFVSLIMPGTTPAEQLGVLARFAGGHPAPRAVVIGLDPYWCMPPEALPRPAPFPDWLYGDSDLRYLGGLVGQRALEAAWRRLGVLLGRAPPARPDGFWDYTATYVALGAGDPAAVAAKLGQPARIYRPNPDARFPGLDALPEALSRLPPRTAVALLRPPLFATGLPPPGSPEEEAARQCRERAAGIARSRPSTRLLDWSVDRAETRDPAHFFDHGHMTAALAEQVAAEVGAALAEMMRE